MLMFDFKLNLTSLIYPDQNLEDDDFSEIFIVENLLRVLSVGPRTDRTQVVLNRTVVSFPSAFDNSPASRIRTQVG